MGWCYGLGGRPPTNTTLASSLNRRRRDGHPRMRLIREDSNAFHSEATSMKLSGALVALLATSAGAANILSHPWYQWCAALNCDALYVLAHGRQPPADRALPLGARARVKLRPRCCTAARAPVIGSVTPVPLARYMAARAPSLPNTPSPSARNLSSSQLTGSIPSELGALTALTALTQLYAARLRVSTLARRCPSARPSASSPRE